VSFLSSLPRMPKTMLSSLTSSFGIMAVKNDAENRGPARCAPVPDRVVGCMEMKCPTGTSDEEAAGRRTSRNVTGQKEYKSTRDKKGEKQIDKHRKRRTRAARAPEKNTRNGRNESKAGSANRRHRECWASFIPRLAECSAVLTLPSTWGGISCGPEANVSP
jgi:hypothetical protein